MVDFRTGDPKLALVYLNLIGDTYHDHDIQQVSAHPDFEVVFGGQSLKMLAKKAKGYTPEQEQTIAEINHKVSALAKEGIKFHYCAYGAKLFGVEPPTLAGVDVVDNGWVSLVGYQATGYSLLAAY
jgi:intracellular sulfur oxidation DsrE/DsrF family protein